MNDGENDFEIGELYYHRVRFMDKLPAWCVVVGAKGVNNLCYGHEVFTGDDGKTLVMYLGIDRTVPLAGERLREVPCNFKFYSIAGDLLYYVGVDEFETDGDKLEKIM